MSKLGLLCSLTLQSKANALKVNMPEWIACLNPDNWLKKVYIEKIRESVIEIDKLRDVEHITKHFSLSQVFLLNFFV